MSVYPFLPSRNLLTNPIGFSWQSDIFTEQELDLIEKIGDSLPNCIGSVGSQRSENIELRKCFTAWISNTAETAFIYEKIADYVSYANSKYFDFNLFGFSEDFQYTIYDGSESHYDWHLDITPEGSRVSTRKLSFVLQLSDPSNYGGGNLELLTGSTPTILEKKRGMAHVFPSYLLHRVTPVTSGIRKTLVVWVCGERFK